MNEKRKISVVGAAIINEGRVLLAQRPQSHVVYKSLKWEFPGGKIESGESIEEAIRREIHEELDCEIEVDAQLPEMEYEYPDFTLYMTICICHLVGNKHPKALEHNAIRWCEPDELQWLDWAPADAECWDKVLNNIK